MMGLQEEALVKMYDLKEKYREEVQYLKNQIQNMNAPIECCDIKEDGRDNDYLLEENNHLREVVKYLEQKIY